jgi:hypothetical protein
MRKLTPGAEQVDEIRELEWSGIGTAVTIPDVPSVSTYLVKHYDTVPLLEHFASKVRTCFGDAEVTLELYTDPEIDDEYLTIYVRKAEMEQADLEMIDRLSDEFSSEIAPLSGWVALMPDFRPHR